MLMETSQQLVQKQSATTVMLQHLKLSQFFQSLELLVVLLVITLQHVFLLLPQQQWL